MCGKCECSIAVFWERLQECSKVTKFLMGLNDSYEQTHRHIIMLKALPSMENAYNIVAQDERQNTMKSSVDPAIFYAQTRSTIGHDSSVDPGVVEFAATYNAYRSKRPFARIVACWDT